VTAEEYDAFCAGLEAVSHIVQWGGASVWKVAGKVFAIGAGSDGREFAVTFKCSPLSFAMLKDQPGLRPAPYLASRGLSWLQRLDLRTLDDAALKAYLRRSHWLAASTLPRNKREALALREPRA